MASLRNSIMLQSNMVSVLRSTVSALDSTVSAMNRVGAAGAVLDNQDIWRDAHQDIGYANAALEEYNNSLHQINQTQNEVNSSFNNGFSGWRGTFAGIASAIYTVKEAFNALSGAMSIVDDYTLTAARLGLVNDGSMGMGQFQDSIYYAALRSRGDYGSMADAVAKLGMLSGNAFSGSQEIVDFTELMQKTFKLSGTPAAGQQAAMLQLTQAMASGRLQGDEYVSIRENASMLAQAIADYTGVGIEGMKELASEGGITSNVIRGALFSVADDINEKFGELPKTFGDVVNEITTHTNRAFWPVFERITDIINSERFQQFEVAVMGGIDKIAAAAMWGIDIMGVLADHIEVVLGVTIPLGVGIALPAIWSLTAAVGSFAIAWWAAHWPIFLVSAAIGGAIAIAKHYGATTMDILSVISGGIFAVAAVLYDSLALQWNAITYFLEYLYNGFWGTVYRVQLLFYDLAQSVLGYFNNIATAIIPIMNTIFGTNIDPNIVGNLAASIEAPTQRAMLDLPDMDYVNPLDAWQKGYDMVGNAANAFNQYFGDVTNPGAMGDIGEVGNVANVDKINSEVNIADENLKYLVDGITRQYVNKINLQTVQPNISVEFHGDINENADMQGLSDRLLAEMQEKIFASTDLTYNG